MKAKIKKGAFVGQDFGVHKWPHHESFDVDQIFDVFDFNAERVRLVADGFGILSAKNGEYGNGALYVKKEDLIFEEELNPCPSCGSKAIGSDEITKGVGGTA
ncbi:MAG: hypothetical protein KAV87_55675 [Desulfobacteraceae bacterium]|nr:hypothetical protein [Desulfobacteraceae bacterium]